MKPICSPLIPARCAIVWILLVGAIASGCHANPPSATTRPAEAGVLFDEKSEFNHVIVREDSDGIRYLYFEEDGAIQSAAKPGEPDNLILPYTQTVMAGLAVVPKPERILVIGLGGGSMSTHLQHLYPDAHIDSVELDPMVADVAKRFFDFREDDRNKIHVGDGRAFVEASTDRYDLIFLDAYGPDYIPYTLATREFLVAVRDHLAPGGAVVANIWGASSNKLYDAMLRTYQDVFKQTVIVRTPKRGNQAFIAVPDARGLKREDLVQSAKTLQTLHGTRYDLPAIIEAGFEDVTEKQVDAKVLLDADAPKD